MHKKLSIVQKFGYGIGDYGLNLFFQTVGLYLLFFYTDVLNIQPATAGFIYMIAIVWDGITDPLMGYFASKTKSRFGKYRPYLILGTIPLAISFVFLFSVPELSAAGLIVYALITHILFRTLYTVVSVPYSTLSAEITQDSKERGSLAGFRMVFAVLGALSVAILTKPLVAKWGLENEALGFVKVAILFSILAIIILAICFWLTKEKNESKTETEKVDFKSVFGMILKNQAFLIIALIIIIASATSIMTSKMILYYFKYNLDKEEMTGLGLLALLGTTLVGVPFWAVLSSKIGKKNIILFGGIFSILAYFLLYLNSGQNMTWVLLNFAMVGIGLSSIVFAFWAILPDTVEYGEWKTGIRAESMVFGLGSLCQKIALGIGAGLLGLLLDTIGYEANQTQSGFTLAGIQNIMTLIPLFGVILTMITIYFYPLSDKLHKQIVEEIKERKQD